MTTPKELPALPMPSHGGPGATGTYFDSFTADQMQAYAREAVAASLQGIERDAARYRWLSANYMPPSCEEAWDAMDTSLLQGGTGLDAAIDAAMKDAP